MRAIVTVSVVLSLLLAGAAPGRADDQADAVKLVDQAVKALGGEARLTKFQGASVKATGAISGIPISEESTASWPDRYRFDLSLEFQGKKISEIVVIDRDKGWIQLDGKTMDMDKEMLATFKDYMYALWLGCNPLELKAKDYQLAPVGEIQVGGRPAVGILVKHKGRRDVNLYFDKETGLPVKADVNAPALEGGADVLHEMLFSDHKEFDGIKTYTKIVWNRDGKDYLKREISEVKPLEKVEDGSFSKP